MDILWVGIRVGLGQNLNLRVAPRISLGFEDRQKLMVPEIFEIRPKLGRHPYGSYWEPYFWGKYFDRQGHLGSFFGSKFG